MWNTKGDERGKAYRVYKELEAQYQRVLEEKSQLETLLRSKDATIRSLAMELAGVPAMPDDQSQPAQDAPGTRSSEPPPATQPERLKTPLPARSTLLPPPAAATIRPVVKAAPRVVQSGVSLCQSLTGLMGGNK